MKNLTITVFSLLLSGLVACDGQVVEFKLDTPVETAPLVTNVTPLDGATDVALNVAPTATFNTDMDATTINGSTFLVEQGSTPISGTVTLNGVTNTAIFTPDVPLSFSLVYTATITTGAEDTDGLGISSDYTWNFTTTDMEIPPEVIVTNPVDGERGVSVDMAPTATFSMKMDSSTINDVSFLVEQGATPISGTVTLDSGTNTATFTPDVALDAGLVYSATVTTAAQSQTGLGLVGDYTWSFSTAAGEIPPEVIFTVPFDTATNVSPDITPTATFDTEMNAATINSLTVLMEQGSTPISGTVTLDASNYTATFTPDVPLDFGQDYTLTITTGAEDRGGLGLTADYTWTFSTVDLLVPPEVIFNTPANGDRTVAVDVAPTATFSTTMDSATINPLTFLVTQGTTPVVGLVTLDSGTNTATFTPTFALTTGLIYTATITTGAEDLSGTALVSDYSWSFSTVDAAIPPHVIFTTPADGETDVSVDVAPTATFDVAMDTTTVNTLTFLVEQGSTPISGTVTLNMVTNTATFLPDVPLDFGLIYTATVTTGAEDLNGLPLSADYTWDFTTEGLPPEVIATTPADAETGVSLDVAPTATFSTAMDPATINDLSFLLFAGATPITGTVTLDSATNTAIFLPDFALKDGLIYTATITTDAQDLAGTALVSDYSWNFSPAGIPPEVTSTVPVDGATGVSVNTHPTATFSTDMDPATITALTFLLEQGTTLVQGTVDFDSLSNTATFTPDTALDPGVVYTATITTRAQDLTGVAMVSDYIWSFTTGACSLATIDLGTAGDFVILAGSTITSTGLTVITGDIGVSPGTAVTGFPPGLITGSTYAGDPTSAAGIADLTTAYNDAAGRSLCPISVAGNLGGQTLPPGLYTSTSSLEISSGDLTLDAQGDSSAVFIFQTASTLTTTSGRQVFLINGAKAENVYWQVGSSATLGTTSVFQGTILADQAITLQTGATLNGRVLARIAAVSLDTNIIVTP